VPASPVSLCATRDLLLLLLAAVWLFSRARRLLRKVDGQFKQQWHLQLPPEASPPRT
jgi:hypothetical protein